ncbi:MAG: helix-turn-helix domain-containing protein [Patescibacteria group bacterium]
MKLNEQLLALGLGQKEAHVYLSALELGYGTVLEIAKKAEINRTTAYTHIKNLISRGLIIGFKKFDKVYYAAEKPDRLQKLYEEQEREVIRRREILQNLVPELESLYHLAKDRPSVRYFDYNNPEDLKKVREEIELLRTDELFNIFNYDQYGEYFSRSHVEKILKRVQCFKALYISKEHYVDRKVKPLLENKKFNLKFLPGGKFGFLCEILITDRTVYIAGNGGWLIISDKLFAHTLQLLFEAMWGIAEKIN